MSLAFVPLYIKFMGIESYGLVGIYVSLQSIFGLLDMGISTTLNRELAMRMPRLEKTQEMRNLVRTLEIVYWAMAITVGVVVVGISSPIVQYWVKPVVLPRSTVYQAILIMGGIMAFQLPLRFYSGGLMGLEKQVMLNCINIFFATMRGLGAVLILWQISSTIQAFFIWQLCLSILNVITVRTFLWENLPKTGARSHIQKNLLFSVWRFAAGLTGISLASLMLTQTDKIILSKTLTLEMFGYYTLAFSMAGSLMNFIGPISSALFPRFSRLVSINNQIELNAIYHKGCQFLSVIILPPAIVVSLFSSEILLLWTSNPVIVKNSHVLVSLLTIGVALNGLMYLPFLLTLSYGWTKFGLYSDIIAAITLVPLIYFLSTQYGAVGAAIGWIILNSGYVLICIQVLHARLLKGEQWRWYVNDVLCPISPALIIALIWRIFIPNEISRYALFAYLSGVSITTLLASIIVNPFSRLFIIDKLFKLKIFFGNKSIVEK